MFSTSLIGILLVDLFLIDGKYINPKPSAALEQNFRPDATITFLKQQPGFFRVFPLGSQLFMDNTFAYHGLHSIGGYSPAKLKIYQTMLDSCLYRGPDPEFPLNMNVVNMLNTKYVLAKGRLPEDRFELVSVDQPNRILIYRNTRVLPRAFFVGNAIIARSDQEVFRIMNSAGFDASKTAILEKPLPNPIAIPDSSYAEISEFTSGEVAVKTYTSSPALLVLSEVYYPAGWKAYVDGIEAEILKTNYVLRSIHMPVGSHDVVFKFEPALYKAGLSISVWSWVVVGFCTLFGYLRLRKKSL